MLYRKLSEQLEGRLRSSLLLRTQVERATFVSLVGRLFKILVGLILIIALLSRAGVNVSALVTGLGIGGIALALAAQKSLADLFGRLSIILRGAVRVGDTCQIAGITGIVEDIGISSLSLRTRDRSVVSIPNAKVAEVNLENFSLRDQFWVHQIFAHDLVDPAPLLVDERDPVRQRRRQQLRLAQLLIELRRRYQLRPAQPPSMLPHHPPRSISGTMPATVSSFSVSLSTTSIAALKSVSVP